MSRISEQGSRVRALVRRAAEQGLGGAAMKTFKISIVLLMSLLLAACSGTDVELKGGVFDLMGISGTMGQQREEPEMQARSGIVIPPSTASLPAPGPAPKPQVAANSEAFPVNPEDAKKLKNADLVRKHEAFCDKARQRHEAGLTPTVESSPWGACHESVLRNFTGTDLSGDRGVAAR